MYIRRYSAPLTVFAAGVLGFSLICIVSAAALTNPASSTTSDIGAQDIVDSAFSNPISTAVAMTVVEITAYIPSPTPSLENLLTPSPSGSIKGTPTVKAFITWTPLPPTRDRDGDSAPSSTATKVPSQTPTRIPPTLTHTSTPTRIIPTATRFIPTATDTDVPEPTNTPADTNTPEPTPTSTDVPTQTIPPDVDPTFTPEPTIESPTETPAP